MSSQNSIKYLFELKRIFEEKDWNTKENYESVYNAFSSLDELITENDEEYKLIIELLDRYNWISLNDYFNECRKLLKDIIADFGPRVFNIYTFPIIKKRHEHKVKSGSFITYLIKAILPTIPEARKLSFEDINTYDELKQKRFTQADVILLVDDFIGSGETFDECISNINKIDRRLFDKIVILTIAIKKDTYDSIKGNYKIYYSLPVLKGITDYNVTPDVENKKVIMKRIEGKFFSNINDYSLGYKESECLISLLRTPDNTFPLFWKNYKKRVKLNPPFPRYEKAQ